ncbi:initiation factor, subunit 2 family protein [Dictyocaulus viviparus]|uniref:Translation initiation factor eIF2B subunit beta n=1 Tax=Dictyocaulus viviparus TaxID=29172 RepID=A0A0D8XQW4_DICVI|nr:initiation factor, subunit 2 family protein [Dictyocaulus viviparus]
MKSNTQMRHCFIVLYNLTRDMEICKELEEQRRNFISLLRRNPVPHSSLDLALETLQFLRKVVIYEKELLAVLTSHGRWICAMEPTELVIRNVVMMVTKLARDENFRLIMGEPISAFDSLNKLWMKNEDKYGAVGGKKLKKGLLQAINEVVSEMTLSCDNISSRASDLINPQDVLIVHHLIDSSNWSTSLNPIKTTRKHRVMSVVCKNDFDITSEIATPIQLCDVGIKMCEATKVLLSGVAVFPDGSCLVPAGGLSICLSAQRHTVPVYVLAAFYKITPLFVPDDVMININKAPGLPFSYSASFCGLVEVVRPMYDIIPASLVTLYISNSASILPSHVYRLIGDYYHPEDVAESQDLSS